MTSFVCVTEQHYVSIFCTRVARVQKITQKNHTKSLYTNKAKERLHDLQDLICKFLLILQKLNYREI